MLLDDNRLGFVLDELVEEYGVTLDVLVKIIIEEMTLVYKKAYPDRDFFIDCNKKNNKISVFVRKNIVKKVENDDLEISQKKSLTLDLLSSDDNQTVLVPFEKGLGRIEIIQVRNAIGRRIREIEAAHIFKEFYSRKGTLVSGMVTKIDTNGLQVNIGEFNALLPANLMIPGEVIPVRSHIRALVKEVYEIPHNDGQIILDRSSIEFIKKILEFEIPEIFEGIIRIEKIVRHAGYKTKILVSSRDSNINPVGTCVGVKGSRIQPILKELGLEKLDIVPSTSKMEDLVAFALKPAVIESVSIVDGRARIIIAPEQRSIAVGRGGRNVGLASELVGMNIDIVDNNNYNREKHNNTDNNNNYDNI